MNILDWWKESEAEDTYARTEVLIKYIRKLAAQGYAAKHPVKDGKAADFLLRLEDYTPGGDMMLGNPPETWIDRLDNLIYFLKKTGLKLNMAVIPRYEHPCKAESHTWDDTDQEIPLLKRYARTEMSARFSYTPLIWETPHYAGNPDAYRAAAESGFQFFTESDTMLFTNRFSYLNLAQGLIMSLPETAFDFRDTPEQIAQMEPIKRDFILPRLVRLNAPYYTFYRNTSQEQYQSLLNVSNKARTYDLWYPRLEEFGLFWKNRETALVSGGVDKELRKMIAQVSNSFAGLTLAFRLPDGAVAETVLINGAPAVSTSKLVDGVQLVYVVLPAGTTATVEVNFN